MKSLIRFFIICLFFFGTQSFAQPGNQNVNSAKYLIDLTVTKRNSESRCLNDIVRTNKIIVLKGRKDFYLTGASRIRVFKDRVYIFDRSQEKLFIFEASGSPVRQVLKRGNGPGEVSKAFDFDLDTENMTLNVLDVNQRKLLLYDLNGVFIQEIKNDFQSFYFSCLYPQKRAFYIGYFDPSYYNLHITNTKGKIDHLLFPFPQNIKSMFFPFCGHITRGKAGILYSDACSNEIYQIFSDESVSLKYYIDFGKSSWPESQKFDFHQYFMELQRFNIDFLQNFYEESDDGLIFQYQKRNKVYKGYFFKDTRRLYSIESNLRDDLYYKYLSSPRGLSENGDFISYIDPMRIKDELLKAISSGNSINMIEPLKEAIIQSDEYGSNIILVFYELTPKRK